MKLNRIINIFIALVVAAAMCFCMSACGSEDTVEETVEITTPSEETDTAIYERDRDKDSSDDEDTEGDSEKKDKKASSQYEQIFIDCDAEMEEATKKYVKELNNQKSSLSKSDLYDETQDRIKALEKIYDKGKDKMVETMLASTEDDGKIYKKYFKKMTENYTEYSREITSAYTDAF